MVTAVFVKADVVVAEELVVAAVLEEAAVVVYMFLVFTKSVDSNFLARFDWLPSLGISLDIHCFANGEKNGASFRESFRRRN